MEVRNAKKRWELKTGADGRKFYVDHKRRKTAWSLPPGCDQHEVVITNPNFHFRWVKKTVAANAGKQAGKAYYVDYWNLSTHWQPPRPEKRWEVIALFSFYCEGDVGTFVWGTPGTGLMTDAEFSYKCIKSQGEMGVSFTEKGLWFTPVQLTVVKGKKRKGSRVDQRLGCGLENIHGAYDCGELSMEDAKKCRDVRAKLKAAGLSSSNAKAAAAAIEAKTKVLYHVQVDLRDSTKFIVILDNKKHAERLVKCIRAGLHWFQGKSIDYMVVNKDLKSSRGSRTSLNSPADQRRASGRAQSASNIHATSAPVLAASAGAAAGMGVAAAAAAQRSSLQRAQSEAAGVGQQEQPTSPRMQMPVLCQPTHAVLQQEPSFIAAPMQMPAYYMQPQGQQQGAYPNYSPQQQQQQAPPGYPNYGQGQQQYPQYPQQAGFGPAGYAASPMQAPPGYPQQQQQQPPGYGQETAPPPGHGQEAAQQQQMPPGYSQETAPPPGHGHGQEAAQQQIPPGYESAAPETGREHASLQHSDGAFGSASSDLACDASPPPSTNASTCSLGIDLADEGLVPPPALSPCVSPRISPRNSVGDFQPSAESSPRTGDTSSLTPQPGAPGTDPKALAAALATAAAAGVGAAAAGAAVVAVVASEEERQPEAEEPPAVLPMVVVDEWQEEEKAGQEGACGRRWLEKAGAIDFPSAFGALLPVSSSCWRKFLAGKHHHRLDGEAKAAIDEFVNAGGQWKALLSASQELQSALAEILPEDHLAKPHVVAWSLLDVYLTAKTTQGKASEAAKMYHEVLGEEFLRFSIREALSLDVVADDGIQTVRQSGIVLEVASFATYASSQAAKELQKKFLVLQSNGSVTRGLVPGAVAIPLACLLDLPTCRVLVTAVPFAGPAQAISESQEQGIADTHQALATAVNLPSESAGLLHVSPDSVGLFHINHAPDLLPRHTLAIFGRPAARIRPELLQLLLNEELLQSAGHVPLLQPTLPQITAFVVDVMIPAFLKVVSTWLEVLTSEFGFQILTYFVHAYGLNLRLLAVLRAGVPPDAKKIRRLFMTEMAARSVRNVIRSKLAASPDADAKETVQQMLNAVMAGAETEWHLLLDALELAFPGIGLPGNNDVNGKGEVTVTLGAVDPTLLVRRVLQLVGGYASDEAVAAFTATPPRPAPGGVVLSPLSRATVPRTLLWTVIRDKESSAKAQLLLTALLEYPLDDGAQREFLDKASDAGFTAKPLRAFASTSGAIRSDTLQPIGVRVVSVLAGLTDARVAAEVAAAESHGASGEAVAAALAFLCRFHSPCGVYGLNEDLARLLLAIGVCIGESAQDDDSDDEDGEDTAEKNERDGSDVEVLERALGYLFAALHELQSHSVVSELLLDIYVNLIATLSCLPPSYPNRDFLLFAMAIYHVEAHQTIMQSPDNVPTSRARSAGLHLFMTTLSQVNPATFGINAMAMWKLRAYQCLSALAKEKSSIADVTAFQQVIELCQSEGVDVTLIPEQMDMTQEEFIASLVAERKAHRKQTLPPMMNLRIAAVTHLLGFYCKPWRRQ